MGAELAADTGSFRDPGNRVYIAGSGTAGARKRVLRGLDKQALSNFSALAQESFFQEFVKQGQVVRTDLLSSEDEDARAILADDWAAVLEHQSIPFITYPYEWTFSMLKDAALLQLHLMEKSLEQGWTLKDATPYNLQWIGAQPRFIDIPSFEPWIEGEAWVGYRQFCSLFLTPLLLRAHQGIDHLPLLRSCIDGIPPTEAIKYFSRAGYLKKGVLSHIVFPAKVENAIAKRERDNASAKHRGGRKQSIAMVLGLIQSLTRLVRRLSIPIDHTDWSQYDKTHSYGADDFAAKTAFVQKHAAAKTRNHIWDIGCNTGTFSRICSDHCQQVIALDGDHNAVEQLYLAEKRNAQSNILPLVMNLANMSPNHGWAGKERLAFDSRCKPDLVLCLALIHHLRLSANIPIRSFLEWLRALDCDVIIEFVNRTDEMVIKLLTNKKEAVCGLHS